MTSLYFDPALLEGPSDPEPREQLIVNGRYYLPPLDDPTGKRRSLQRVTNFIKQLSEQGGLTTWKLRSAVIGLARDERRYDLACSLNPDSPRGKQELDQLIEECIDLANAGPSGGNITGTALHNYTDDVAGSYPIRVRDKWVPKLENYQRALHDKGLRVVPGLQERLVVSERYGTCGRLDDVYEDPFGTLRVGDRKSQKEFQTWWEVGAQLALYQSSDAMWNEAECRWEEMPTLADDFCHVAWMPLSHPAAKKGDSVDTVTIYDLPLAGPREVLEWCLQVRTLRTQARRWGQERLDLDAFARVARDIRDAETHDELTDLFAAATKMGHWAIEHEAMAAKRWEQLGPRQAEPVATPLNDAVHVMVTSNYSFDTDETKLTVSGTPDAVTRVVARMDVSGSDGPLGPLSQEEIERRRADVFERLRSINGVPLHHTQVASAEPVIRPISIANQGIVSAEALESWVAPASAGPNVSFGFDPALFVGPEQEEATFLDTEAFGGRTVDEVPGPQRPAEALGELTARQGADEETLRKPIEWAAHLDLREFQMQADSDGVWCKPMPLKTFRHLYAAEIALVEARAQAHPVATAQFTHSRHENATVVELPDAPTDEDSSPGWDPVKLQPTLDTVPLKIVREIHTRAGNSKTSRGRVRLLNDLDKKYEKHQEALLPALLREWLVLDGLAGEPGFNKDGVPRVANTGGSSREPMDARLAGRISLTDHLAAREVPKSVAITAETEASTAPVPDRDTAPSLSERAHAGATEMRESERALTKSDDAVLPDGTPVGERERQMFGDLGQVRQKYMSILEGPQAGKHSIARLIELAKEARDGLERSKVFEAISRYHTWTGAIAAEINQHYLDAGQSTVDFDPYFVAQQDVADDQVTADSALPLDPDDPTTVADALHLLEGVESRAQLTLMWSQLAAKPYFQDQALQEGLLAKMMSLKN